jgi:starch-binding outer membrane protein, SusD/RagB family
MKKSFYIYAIAIAFIGLVGCDKNLQDVKPTQSIDQDQSLNTSRDVEAYLIGCYDGIQGTNANGNTFAGGFQYTSELLGHVQNGEVRFAGTFANLLELISKTTTTINSTAEDQWVRSYSVINRCNTVLSALDKVDAAKKARFEGEALFLRGALYFEMARLYGKQWGDGDNATNPAVPLILTPTKVVDASSSVARSSVAQVYTQAINDMTKAIGLLPVANGVYANKGAAYGMLARLYLQQADFVKARAAADSVIASNRYRLVMPFSAAFNTKLYNGGSNPAEYIFAVQASDQDGFNGMNTFFSTTISAIPGTAGRGDIRILAAHKATYDANDDRGKFFIKPSAASTNEFTNKFIDRFGNVVVLRLAEMYLIRAECNFRLNESRGATPLEDINALRTRANATPLTALTLDVILKERRNELAFEGHRLHDIKRTKGTVGTLQWNDPKLILPVPQREMDVNKTLVQNAGY